MANALLIAITARWLEAYEEQFEPSYWQEDPRVTEQRKWDLADERAAEDDYKKEHPNWEAEQAAYQAKEALRKQAEAEELERLYGDLPF